MSHDALFFMSVRHAQPTGTYHVRVRKQGRVQGSEGTLYDITNTGTAHIKGT